MAETIGALIFTSIEAAGVAGATAAGSTILVGTLTVNAVVGTAAIAAASIGLSYALRQTPDVPRPENGSQAIKQAVPPRIRGYWINRMAGYYMLFEARGAAPNTSYDVIAYHHGKVETVLGIYLHDDTITTSPDFTNISTTLTVNATTEGYYNGSSGVVQIELKVGDNPQTVATSLTGDSIINGTWTTSFFGDEIAYLVIKCVPPSDPAAYTKIFPHGKPEPSVLAKCSPIWDPRDITQLRLSKSTWRASPNPVLQLIDYLTGDPLDTGGPGLDYDTVIAPVIDQWTTEATLCDGLVGGIARYQSSGWYQFDNKPEDVISKILSTCDGYLMENGDGTLSLTVGYYRAPTDPALTSTYIMGFSVDYGISDENRVNQLDITITDPNQKYVQSQIDPIRAEESISVFGMRSQTLDLTWVQQSDQAQRLGGRAIQRLNAGMSGTLITTLYGFRYFGKRWMALQYPTIAGLEDCIVEIQSVKTDLLNGRITFEWKKIDAVGLLLLQ